MSICILLFLTNPCAVYMIQASCALDSAKSYTRSGVALNFLPQRLEVIGIGYRCDTFRLLCFIDGHRKPFVLESCFTSIDFMRHVYEYAR